jgi:hypothetical protein
MQSAVSSMQYARRESSLAYTPDTGRRRPTTGTLMHARASSLDTPRTECVLLLECVLLSLASMPHAHSPHTSLRSCAAELFVSGQSHVRNSAYRARSCSATGMHDHCPMPHRSGAGGGHRYGPVTHAGRRRGCSGAPSRCCASFTNPHVLVVLRTPTPCSGLERAPLHARTRATLTIAAKRGHSGVQAWHCRVACCLTAPHLCPTRSLSI